MKLDGILYINFTLDNLFQEVTAWLATNDIEWCLLGLHNDRLKRRCINLLVPFDETDPVHQKLARYLENPDGSMKIPGAAFYYTPLTDAMKHEHQERLEWWERHYEETLKWHEWRKRRDHEAHVRSLDVADQLGSVEEFYTPLPQETLIYSAVSA